MGYCSVVYTLLAGILTSELPMGALCWHCSAYTLFWDFSSAHFLFWLIGLSNYHTIMDHAVQTVLEPALFTDTKDIFPCKYIHFYVIMFTFA